MAKLNWFERLFHKKTIIKSVFIFPLISCVVMGLAIKDFADLHRNLAYFSSLNDLFIGILVLLLLNMLANFASLVLYFCLSNRVEHLSKKYNKK